MKWSGILLAGLAATASALPGSLGRRQDIVVVENNGSNTTTQTIAPAPGLVNSTTTVIDTTVTIPGGGASEIAPGAGQVTSPPATAEPTVVTTVLTRVVTNTVIEQGAPHETVHTSTYTTTVTLPGSEVAPGAGAAPTNKPNPNGVLGTQTEGGVTTVTITKTITPAGGAAPTTTCYTKIQPLVVYKIIKIIFVPVTVTATRTITDHVPMTTNCPSSGVFTVGTVTTTVTEPGDITYIGKTTYLTTIIITEPVPATVTVPASSSAVGVTETAAPTDITVIISIPITTIISGVPVTTTVTTTVTQTQTTTATVTGTGASELGPGAGSVPVSTMLTAPASVSLPLSSSAAAIASSSIVAISSSAAVAGSSASMASVSSVAPATTAPGTVSTPFALAATVDGDQYVAYVNDGDLALAPAGTVEPEVFQIVNGYLVDSDGDAFYTFSNLPSDVEAGTAAGLTRRQNSGDRIFTVWAGSTVLSLTQSGSDVSVAFFFTNGRVTVAATVATAFPDSIFIVLRLVDPNLFGVSTSGAASMSSMPTGSMSSFPISNSAIPTGLPGSSAASVASSSMVNIPSSSAAIASSSMANIPSSSMAIASSSMANIPSSSVVPIASSAASIASSAIVAISSSAAAIASSATVPSLSSSMVPVSSGPPTVSTPFSLAADVSGDQFVGSVNDGALQLVPSGSATPDTFQIVNGYLVDSDGNAFYTYSDLPSGVEAGTASGLTRRQNSGDQIYTTWSGSDVLSLTQSETNTPVAFFYTDGALTVSDSADNAFPGSESVVVRMVSPNSVVSSGTPTMTSFPSSVSSMPVLTSGNFNSTTAGFARRRVF